MKFKVGDRVRVIDNAEEYFGLVGTIERTFMDFTDILYYEVDIGKELPYAFCENQLEIYVEEGFIAFDNKNQQARVLTKEQFKLEELEQRIEKLEKHASMGKYAIDRKENVSNFEKMEQKTIEKRENESIYERNERFSKILKKELERNAIIFNEPKPSLLTKDERVILRNLDKKWKWIARDMEDKNLHIYTLEPTKVIDCWNVAGLDNYENFYIYNHLFQFIKWNDKEPYNIEELLKGECGNE